RMDVGFILNIPKYVVQLKAVKSGCCVHAAFVFDFMLYEDVGGVETLLICGGGTPHGCRLYP
ncbi:hypothetical protein, partial [Peribacillus asahii]|uniref:hypothetical protein n=1 Tax=Peribacillus asahii TaxID=228899 RepID=UPI003815C6F4